MENYEDIMRKGNISRNMDNYPQALKEIALKHGQDNGTSDLSRIY